MGELDSNSDSLKEQFMEAYPVFSECSKGQLSPDDFLSRIVGLGEDGENLLRAALVFEQSQKCVKCFPTVAMALLCSAIEAMTPKSSQIHFHYWLLKNKLDELEMQSRKELKKIIHSAYEEFCKIPHRKGAFYNFKQFLLANCPKQLRDEQPFKMMIDGSNLSFNQTLDFIYDRFRSKFIHEAIQTVSSETPFKNEDKYTHTECLGGLYSLTGKWMNIKPSEGLVWFSLVVKESLYHYLLNPDKPIDSAT